MVMMTFDLCIACGRVFPIFTSLCNEFTIMINDKVK